MFPQAWHRFASFAEAAGIGYRIGQDRLVEAYARLMEAEDPVVRESASQEWALWEDTHISIGAGRFQREPRWNEQRFRHAVVRLTAHYWSHDGFCHPPILEQMDRLRNIPAVMIHGRRDVSSPLRTAWELHRRWPSSRLIVDEGNGHGGDSMVDSWREANHQFVAALDRSPSARPIRGSLIGYPQKVIARSPLTLG